jgi:streptomycin 6-kinase
MGSWSLPSNLAPAGDDEDYRDWVARLPDTVASVAWHWALRVGDPFQPGGRTAWVAPALDPDGIEVVLKVGWRHPEAADEAKGLEQWEGDGAVILYAVQERPDTVALLLETCRPGTALAGRPEPEQDVVIAGLLRRLWRTPGPGAGFRPLRVMCAEWADAFEQKLAAGTVTVDGGLAGEAMALLRQLPGTSTRTELLCTDLHAGNVLAADREPWLVIDPKPYVGDPAYDVTQHILNCEERLRAGPRELAWRLADLAGVDRDRVLLWLFARSVAEAGRRDLSAVARRIAPG